MSEEKSAFDKYKHMQFGTKKAQRFLKRLTSGDSKPSASGLLKSAFKSKDTEAIAKLVDAKPTMPSVLPVVDNADATDAGLIFSLKSILPKSVRQHLKAFGLNFYTEFAAEYTNAKEATVSDVFASLKDKYQLKVPYYLNKAENLVSSAIEKEVAISCGTLGYYFFLSALACLLQQSIGQNKKEFRFKEDPLGLYSYLPSEVADFIYTNFMNQEMNSADGKLLNNISKELRDKCLLHIIIVSILTENHRGNKSMSLDSPSTLTKDLGLQNYAVASLCQKVGLGCKFSSDYPENLNIFIKAPLVIPVVHSKRR